MKVIPLDFSDFNITIIGLGLIGGSYAMALKELNPKNLWGVDINPDTVKAAENMHIIDRGYIDAEEALTASDIVIISLYPKDTIEFIKKNVYKFKKDAVITDVSGIKGKVVREVTSFIPDSIDFIGAHPMAGREAKGLGYASKEIFADANFIVTPTDKNRKHNIDLVKEMAKAIGCTNIVEISPEVHDKIIGYTSGVPHLIAVALMNSESFDRERSMFIGGSFRDATRVASINTDLWAELFLSNKTNIINELEEFEKNLADIKNAIKNDDIDAMKTIFENAGEKRRELNK